MVRPRMLLLVFMQIVLVWSSAEQAGSVPSIGDHAASRHEAGHCPETDVSYRLQYCNFMFKIEFQSIEILSRRDRHTQIGTFTAAEVR